MFKNIFLIIILSSTLVSPVYSEHKNSPYGSSEFVPFSNTNKLEQLKVVFDYNFEDPAGIQRALYPVSYTMKMIQEYGPVSFEPFDIIVVSHGSEVVAFARQNYDKYRDLIDHAARLAELGVKFKVCNVAAEALGFGPNDFHGFIEVVPNGGYELVYRQNLGYALMPGAATVPAPIINPKNRPYLGKKSK